MDFIQAVEKSLLLSQNRQQLSVIVTVYEFLLLCGEMKQTSEVLSASLQNLQEFGEIRAWHLSFLSQSQKNTRTHCRSIDGMFFY